MDKIKFNEQENINKKCSLTT